MKKIINLFAIVSFVLIGFTSCEKEGVPVEPIPGMGNTPGEIEIKEEFAAPEDVSISIQGANEMTLDQLLNNSQAQLKSTSSSIWYCGAGGSFQGESFNFWIRIRLTLTNSSSVEKRIIFPAGLIFKVQQEGYQNGILLHCVSVCIPPNATQEFYMFAFCLNKGKDGSKADVTYTMPGVTGSDILWNWLLNRLEEKEINIENFIKSTTSAQLKSATEEDMEKYTIIADKLQNALWTLTNDGEKLSKEQLDFIESIPDEE